MIDVKKMKLVSINPYKTNLEAEGDIKWDHIEVLYKQETAFNLEHKAVRIRFTIILKGFAKNKPINLKADYGIEFKFIVENLEEFIIKNDENEDVMNGDLGVTLLSVAFSTARGVLFQLTQNTPFKGVILPIISPKELFSTTPLKNE